MVKNFKAQYGAAKPSVSELPTEVLFELGAAMREGARKYGRHNFLATEISYTTYYDAAMRHLTAAWLGEDIDPDSGVPHLTKAMACLAVLRSAQIHGTAVDDRPPAVPNDFWENLQVMVTAIDERHPGPADPFTEAEAQECVRFVPGPAPDAANFLLEEVVLIEDEDLPPKWKASTPDALAPLERAAESIQRYKDMAGKRKNRGEI